ncbi:MAG: MtrB/PioB family outer membrane beta-barrel protein [Nitrospiraceae bacterium]|nr:MtrB/PioB family outer membrane beta-barrel protein [Nitrospiraceae bacterium]
MKTERTRARFLLVLAVLLALSTPGYGQDDQSSDRAYVYKFPEITPKYSFGMGYAFTGLSGSERAMQYGYTHSSPTFGGSIIAFPFPNRIHLELDVLNKKDYFVDARYAYSDLVLFRYLGDSMFHNLQGIRLTDLDHLPGSPLGVSQEAPGYRYGVRASINHVYLRFKTPDYPLHLYTEGMLVKKEGDIQQIFLGGANDYSSIIRTSEIRKIDWRTIDGKVGINGHLGPVELDYSHSEKRFISEGQGIMSYDYGTGPLPHNVVPDLEGSTDTFRVHSSYTGKIVAAATVSKMERRNGQSNAKADYFIGDAQVRYLPVVPLVLVFKYRHDEKDEDTPDSLPAGFLGFAAFPGVTGIRNAVTAINDTVSGIAQYRVSGNLTLGTEVVYKETRREHAAEWDLPDRTREKTITLNATYRPVYALKLMAKYTHSDFDSPAYNYQPNRSDSGSLTAMWTPVAWASAFFSYELTDGKRDDLIYDQISSASKNRRTRWDKFAGYVTVSVREDLTVTTSYSYWHNKVKQDLIYELDPGAAPDLGVKYRDVAQNYSVSAAYTPKRQISLVADVSHTRGSGSFFPGIADAVSYPSISAFSVLDTTETVYSAGVRYRLPKETEIGASYSYTDYNGFDNPLNPEDTSGTAHIILISLTKKWK